MTVFLQTIRSVSLTLFSEDQAAQPNFCLSLTRILIPFKELQKHITMSLLHKNYPLSSRFLRVRYQLSIIQRTFCPSCLAAFPATDAPSKLNRLKPFPILPINSLPDLIPRFRFGSAKVTHLDAFSKSSPKKFLTFSPISALPAEHQGLFLPTHPFFSPLTTPSPKGPQK
jgi:hypothetical protein